MAAVYTAYSEPTMHCILLVYCVCINVLNAYVHGLDVCVFFIFSFDEIIVGAPLFSTVDKLEKGRVYIYRNNVRNSHHLVGLSIQYRGVDLGLWR